MEHLLARGHRSFLPAQRFGLEYKMPFSFVPYKCPVLAANGEIIHPPPLSSVGNVAVFGVGGTALHSLYGST